MFSVNHMSGIPVYEQLVSQIERFILTGVIKEGYPLPSVRSLSVQLSVNPNTVQKAYSELTLCNVVFSVPGKGCFVATDAVNIIKAKFRKTEEEISAYIKSLKLSGITKQEITKIVNNIYSGGNEL